MRFAPLMLALALAACRKDDDPVDMDKDGVNAATDCDDTDASAFPGAEERCDGVDNDCDGEVDNDPVDAATWYADGDRDGFGDAAVTETACAAPAGYIAESEDCNDQSAAVHPGASESDCADPTDYNCDGSTGYADADGDGFPACEECDDAAAAVNPGQPEVAYDQVDNDCEPLTPDDDLDGDGADHDEDCDDTDASVHPGAEEVPHDGLDNDCQAGDSRDGDGDGYDADFAGGADCDDADSVVSPARVEVVYDGIDNDCDAETLDDDLDGDGAAHAVDCDDQNAGRSPFLTEIPYDGIDNDCRGGDLTDVDGDGYPALAAGGTDCADADASVHPGRLEVPYDGLNNDCAAATPDDDLDGDGDLGAVDCDDRDADVGPSQEEVWYDGLDADCAGDDDFDQDGDGTARDFDDARGADCDDLDAAVGACQLGVFAATAPTTCAVIAAEAPDYPTGLYWVKPSGSSVGAVQAYCDQEADGGGYTFVKMSASTPVYSAGAEGQCATVGMRLLIPRTPAHLRAAWDAAHEISLGSSVGPNYLRLLGIYPNVNGSQCRWMPMTSRNPRCAWHAGDLGPFYVSGRFDVHEPNGDNNTTQSQYYLFYLDEDGQVRLSGMNDITAGYTTTEWLCAPSDKVGPPVSELPESCLEIKLGDGAAADGVYLIDPAPGFSGPIEVFCDMSTDGGGWTLIGKGREGWTWDESGQGDRNALNDFGDDAVVTLPAAVVQALMGGTDGAPKDLVDGLRIDREEMGQYGLKWDFTDMWYFDWNLPAISGVNGISNPLWHVEYTTPEGEVFHGTSADVGQVTDSGTNLNDYRRVMTWSWSGHEGVMGWGAGSNIGVDTDGDGLPDVQDGWMAATENHALPFTTVWVRQ